MSSLFGQFRSLQRDEWSRCFLLSTYFFLVLTVFWVLKPLKRGLLIHYFSQNPADVLGIHFAGANAEQAVKALNVPCALLAAMLFGLLASRFRRQYLVYFFSTLFGGAFLLFAALIEQPTAPTALAFYILGDLFNTIMVVLFWAFTNDLSTSDEARRTYGLIGLGGVLGGFVGATLVNSTVKDFSRSPLLLGCIVPLILISVLVSRAPRPGHGARQPGSHEERKPKASAAALEGARIVIRSQYLLSIAAIVLIYEVASNIIDFQLATVVEKQISGALEKDAFFATVGQFTGLGSIVLQLLVTSYILAKLGPRAGLLLLPLTLAAGSIGFLLYPTLITAAVMSVTDNALNYSVNQSSKETLYTPTRPEVTYQAKAFIDMFVQRFAKALSVAINLIFATVALAGVQWLSLLTLVLTGLWCIGIRIAGREFQCSRDRENALLPGDLAPEPEA